MIKKIIFVLMICLMKSPLYGMYKQNVGEEEYNNTSLTIHLGKPKIVEEHQMLSEKEPKNKKTNILLLCTGNSCRSQMAEGWARHLGSDIAEVSSAGIKAHGLNPYAVHVMKEAGVDISKQTSKVVKLDMIQGADLVVTVCGDADENCPHLPSKTKKIHWPIMDPAKATGTEEEVLKQFQTVRDEIQTRIFALISDIRETL